MLTNTLSLLFDFVAQSSTVSQLLFGMFWVELARGLGCGFSKMRYIAPINQVGGRGAGRQAKRAIGKQGVGRRRDCDVHRCP